MTDTTPEDDTNQAQDEQEDATPQTPAAETPTEAAAAPEDSSGNDIPQESRNFALLIWVGTVFLGFIPGLIVFLMKKEDEYIADQAKEALNWSITVVIGYVASLLLTIILIGPLLMFAIGVCNLVFGVLGAIACSKGEQFRVPWALRLLK